MDCGCVSSAQLCQQDLHDRFAQLRGVAARRGEQWAEDLSRAMPSDLPWPSDSPLVHLIARTHVADLACDPALAEMLARETVRWAARRWAELAAPKSA